MLYPLYSGYPFYASFSFKTSLWTYIRLWSLFLSLLLQLITQQVSCGDACLFILFEIHGYVYFPRKMCQLVCWNFLFWPRCALRSIHGQPLPTLHLANTKSNEFYLYTMNSVNHKTIVSISKYITQINNTLVIGMFVGYNWLFINRNLFLWQTYGFYGDRLHFSFRLGERD